MKRLFTFIALVSTLLMLSGFAQAKEDSNFNGLQLISQIIALTPITSVTHSLFHGEKKDGKEKIPVHLQHRYLHLRKKVIDNFGKRAPGRNILLFGTEPGHPATATDLQKSIIILERFLAPPPAVSTPAASQNQVTQSAISSQANSSSTNTSSANSTGASTSASTTGSSNPNVNPNCESGGNIHAISPGGTYRGKYQFDQHTWNAYAPSGYKGSDPAAAPESVQNQAAANVPYDAWPNC